MKSQEAIDVFYERIGSGYPVLCAFGWDVLGAAEFGKLLPTTSKGRSLIVPHYRGGGRNHPDPDIAHSVRLYALDYLKVLDREGVSRAHVVGMGGMGACTMMELAILAPERVTSAVLHQGWAAVDTSLRWQLRALRNLREHVGFDEYQEAAAALCFSPEYIERHSTELRTSAWAGMRDRKATHLGFIDACLAHDVRARLDQIKAPCLLVTGDELDIMTGSRLLAELVAGITDVRSHVIERAGHARFMEEPRVAEELDAVFAEFVSVYEDVEHGGVPGRTRKS
jgi:3-oxoadipate enol-lactonase